MRIVSEDVVAIVEVTLVGMRTPVRRVLSIPYCLVLSRFHPVLQVAMGWNQQETHAFVGADLVAGNLDEITSLETQDESRVTLDRLLPFIGAEAVYLYDFERERRHRLRLLDLETGTGEITLVQGVGPYPLEDAEGQVEIGNRKKSTDGGKDKAKADLGSLDLPTINQELGRLSNRWRRRRPLAAKTSGRELVLGDTKTIRDDYLRDLQSVRNSILGIEDELARHEAQDLPEFRRCVNLEFGARFSVLRELHQEIDWLSARLTLVQKLMQHGVRPVEKAYLQALRIESGQDSYPDFLKEREEVPPDVPQSDAGFDHQAIKDFISATGNEFLTEEEVESLAQDVLQTASTRDLVAECNTLYRKIVTLLHPDRAGEMTAERKDLWLRAQAAYADGDLLSLRSILDRCGAGTRDQYLTCSEIIEAIADAVMQVQAVQMSRDRLAKEPSWNFFRLGEKRKKSRLRRVAREIEDEENSLKAQLAELQRECQTLEEQAEEWEGEWTGRAEQLDLFR
jgi:hypothetical protein